MSDRIRRLAAWTRTRLAPQRGASLVEYALLVALIALVCIAALTTLGTTTSDQFSEMSFELDNA